MRTLAIFAWWLLVLYLVLRGLGELRDGGASEGIVYLLAVVVFVGFALALPHGKRSVND